MLLKFINYDTDPPGYWHHKQEDGFTVRAGTFGSLWRAVVQYRAEKGLPEISFGAFEDSLCRALPIGSDLCGENTVNPWNHPDIAAWLTQYGNGDKNVWGSPGWKILHVRHLTGDPEADLQWVRAFQFAIPCEICRAHFQEWVRTHPPDVSTPEAFFKWGWEAHNRVRKTQNKSTITLDEAKALYR